MDGIGYIIMALIITGGVVKWGRDFNKRLFKYLENNLSVNLNPARIEKEKDEVQVRRSDRKELNS
jgi:hypothetical protein